MGLSLSLLSKLGVPGVSSVTTDQFYERFFNKDIQKFDQFHTAFIDLCRFINDVMPGKHFSTPTKEVIEDFYENKWRSNSEPEIRKKELTEFVKVEVQEKKTENDKTVIITGMVVPAAAVVLKNTAENLQPVKRFKLHLIPNFVSYQHALFSLLPVFNSCKSEKEQALAS